MAPKYYIRSPVCESLDSNKTERLCESIPDVHESYV